MKKLTVKKNFGQRMLDLKKAKAQRLAREAKEKELLERFPSEPPMSETRGMVVLHPETPGTPARTEIIKIPNKIEQAIAHLRNQTTGA